MQDPSISSELKALIAVVSTLPQSTWVWRQRFLQKCLNWGTERYQRVIREAKAREFVTIVKQNVAGKLVTQWEWDIEPHQYSEPKPASSKDSAAKSHEPGFPSNGEPVARVARGHKKDLNPKYNLKSQEREKQPPKRSRSDLTPFPKEGFTITPHHIAICEERKIGSAEEMVKKFETTAAEYGMRKADWSAAFTKFLLNERAVNVITIAARESNNERRIRRINETADAAWDRLRREEGRSDPTPAPPPIMANCPDCKGTGYEQVDPNFGKGVRPCHCRQRRQAAAAGA
jgi:hypothetical protein